MAQPRDTPSAARRRRLCRVAQPPPGARAIPVGAAPGQVEHIDLNAHNVSRLLPDAIALRGEHDQRLTRC